MNTAMFAAAVFAGVTRPCTLQWRGSAGRSLFSGAACHRVTKALPWLFVAVLDDLVCCAGCR